MREFTIAGLGELLWDVLPEGEVLGGAPANFCYHINKLGGCGVPISTVGEDDRGYRACEILKNKGVAVKGVATAAGYATGWVDAVVDDEGVATYNFPADVAWDHLQITEYAREIQSDLDGICFGSLAQRSPESRKIIYDYLDGLAAGKTLRIFDINLRQQFYSREIILASLERSDIFKLNDDELLIVAGMLSLKGTDRDMLTEICDRFDLSLAILTRGGNGSLLLTKQECSEHSGIATTLNDTIGAGDSFTAAVTIGFLRGRKLDDINEHANKLAAYVCTRQGAMPDIPQDLASF